MHGTYLYWFNYGGAYVQCVISFVCAQCVGYDYKKETIVMYIQIEDLFECR